MYYPAEFLYLKREEDEEIDNLSIFFIAIFVFYRKARHLAPLKDKSN